VPPIDKIIDFVQEGVTRQAKTHERIASRHRSFSPEPLAWFARRWSGRAHPGVFPEHWTLRPRRAGHPKCTAVSLRHYANAAARRRLL